MTILDKRKMLHQLTDLAVKLRCKPNDFLSMEGEPDLPAGAIRLNRLGKCLEMMTYLFEMCQDGQNLSKEEEAHYTEFIRYLKECHEAFEIGKKPGRGS